MKYLGAFKAGHRRGVREFIDDDFSYKLFDRGDSESLKALAWIAKYNNEYYRGVLRKGDKKAIHKSEKRYQEATRSKHARDRDVLCVLRSGRLGQDLVIEATTSVLEDHINRHRQLSHENTVIEMFRQDRKRSENE